MQRIIKIGYENRVSRSNKYSRDLESVPKILLANHFLKDLSLFTVGDLVSVEYSPNSIIIKKLIY
jgi:hypothetical protein